MRTKPPSTLLYAVALLCVVLLFVGQGKFDIRSLDHAWDAGHLPAFGLFAYLLVTRWKQMSQRHFWNQLCTTLMLIFVASLLTETLQYALGRTFSLLDIRKNLLGAAAALVFFTPSRINLKKGPLALLKLIVLVGIVIELIPVGRALIDEANARQQFPVLSTFETPFEIDRWSGSAHLRIDSSLSKSGAASMRIELGTTPYSGAALVYFPRDWRDWQWLCFDLFNPDNAPIHLTVRVNDRAHKSKGYAFTDRFNRSFNFEQGWHSVAIALEEIRTAPKGRMMQMDGVDNVMLFATRLPIARTIYIDNLRLHK